MQQLCDDLLEGARGNITKSRRRNALQQTLRSIIGQNKKDKSLICGSPAITTPPTGRDLGFQDSRRRCARSGHGCLRGGDGRAFFAGILASAVLADALALAFRTAISVTAVRTHALALAHVANVPLSAVLADASALAFLASISVSAMHANAATPAQLASPSQLAVLANTLAAAILAVVLLPAVRASGCSSALHTVNPELLVYAYAPPTAFLALVLVPSVRAVTFFAISTLQAVNVVLAYTAGTRARRGRFLGEDSFDFFGENASHIRWRSSSGTGSNNSIDENSRSGCYDGCGGVDFLARDSAALRQCGGSFQGVG